MDSDINVITALIAAFGGVVGGIISLLGVKLTADNQARERRERLLRDAATKRLDALYEPLLNFISAGAPDELYFDEMTCSHIIELIEKNKRVASPDLLNVFYSFQAAYHNDFPEISRGLDGALYNTVSREYSALKDLLGYGAILSHPSSVKRVFTNVRMTVKSKLRDLRSEYR
jgi:hypothetical protein